jgi:serine/threonine protein kinase
MRITKKPDGEPIPGYRLVEPLGSGGFGEVWKCEAPGGLHKAIKFVPASSNLLDGPCRSREELRAIERIKDLRHPFLLSMERVEVVDGDLVIVMELADKSLDDLLQKSLAAGQTGLPRADVLRYLTESAEVLDLMNLEYGLQHLDIKPRNLFLIRGHVKVADFGLVQSLGDKPNAADGAAEGMNLSAITPLYAAPELFRSTISPHCDQYSLALVFHELLTGQLPFNGKNLRQLMFQHTLEKPPLEALPAADRPAVARALSKDPQQRFGSCTDFVRALGTTRAAATGAPRPTPVGRSGRVRPGLASRTGVSAPSGTETRGDASLASTVSLGPAEARVLPDYQFLGCLSRDPLGETWEAQTAEGKRRLVKFFYVARGGNLLQEEAIKHLQTLRHPALLPVSVTRAGPGALVAVTDLVETSLRQRFQEWQARGERGIPRTELLARLQSAAEALDQLYQQHGLHHLELNPSRLLLPGTDSSTARANASRSPSATSSYGVHTGKIVPVWRRKSLRSQHFEMRSPCSTAEKVLLGDFGLAQLLWVPAGLRIGQAQMRYSAPELAQHLITRSCDQYSLAVIYQEMLTGHHPFRGRMASAVSGKVARLPGKSPSGATGLGPRLPSAQPGPNLDALPAHDRAVLARALDADPERRFATCLEFVRALRAVGGEGRAVADTQPWESRAAPTPTGKPGPRDLITQLFREAKDLWSTNPDEPLPPCEGEGLDGRFVAILPPANAIRKFDAFKQQWGARLVESGERSAVFQVGRKSRSWIPWGKAAASLLVEIRWTQPYALTRKMPEVVVRVRPDGTSGPAGVTLLAETGPLLLESLQKHLLGNPERRTGERVLWPHPVVLSYVMPDRGRTETVACQGKDLSLAGIGLYLPATLPTSQVRLSLATPTHPEAVTVSGSVVRMQRWDDQLFEAGVLFD